MTISIGGLTLGGSGTGGNVYDIAKSFVDAVESSYANETVKTYSNFFNSRRMPEHIIEEYPQFVEFIEHFYQWLASQNDIGVQELITDIDTTSDPVIKLFKEIYAKGFPDKTYDFTGDEKDRGETLVDFINPSGSRVDIRNFLSNCKNLFQYKGTSKSFEYFMRTFFDSDSTVTESSTWVLRCSEAPYRGASAGVTGAEAYYWGSTAECVILSPFRPLPGLNILTNYCATGPCWTNLAGEPCWAGGSYDAQGNQLLPPCDKPGCAPGSPQGVHYDDEIGTLSGNSKLHDNKYWQNYAYLFDSEVPIDEYLPYVKKLLSPSGLFIGANRSVWETIPQPGTTGDVYPIEQPIIGNYTAYRFGTTMDLRNNINGVDLYPCGYNPYLGNTYTIDHIQSIGTTGPYSHAMWYKNESGTTAHQPYDDAAHPPAKDVFSPLGYSAGGSGTSFGTGATAAYALGMSFFRIYHHPNSWSFQVPEGISFGGVNLGDFSYLTSLNTGTGSPNIPDGNSGGCPAFH